MRLRGRIISFVRKKALDMIRKKTGDLNVIKQIMRTKTFGSASGRILDAWRQLEMNVGTRFIGMPPVMAQSRVLMTCLQVPRGRNTSSVRQ